MDPLSFLWLFFILSALQPVVQRQYLAGQRRRRLAKLATERNATVITLIHRQETLSFLGLPLTRHIDIDDSQTVLREALGPPTRGGRAPFQSSALSSGNGRGRATGSPPSSLRQDALTSICFLWARSDFGTRTVRMPSVSLASTFSASSWLGSAIR